MAMNKKTILSSLVITAATFMMAVGNIAFLNPYDIVPGGFTGFAIILNKTLLQFISPGFLALIFNVPLFAFALKLKGKNFGSLSLLGTVAYSGFIDLIPLLNIDSAKITDSALLATIYGGVLMGIGYGTIIRAGGSTGGSDMLANLLKMKKPGLSFGTVLLIIDGFVVALACVAFSIKYGGLEYGVPPALYAFLVIFLSTQVADFVIEGKHSSRTYYIICSEPAAMTLKIFETLKRGVTSLNAKGMFTNEDKQMLVCVVHKSQSAALKQLVLSTDKKAFLFSSKTAEVYGEGFKQEAGDK